MADFYGEIHEGGWTLVTTELTKKMELSVSDPETIGYVKKDLERILKYWDIHKSESNSLIISDMGLEFLRMLEKWL